MATHPPLTADDVLDLPLPDDLIGYELVDGQPVPVTPASPTHGGMVVEVAYRLRACVEQASLPGKV
jgi:Uma2 family endonuclease